jgi:hypothetical protein
MAHTAHPALPVATSTLGKGDRSNDQQGASHRGRTQDFCFRDHVLSLQGFAALEARRWKEARQRLSQKLVAKGPSCDSVCPEPRLSHLVTNLGVTRPDPSLDLLS